MDDEERLDFAQATLRQAEPPAVGSMAERERRLLRMLAVSLASSAFGKGLNKEASLQDTVNLLWRHPAVLAEVSELCGLLRDEIDHLHPAVELDAAVPLSVHSRYSRIEIQAAIGDGDHAAVPTWREGVRWMDEASADVFVFTLDKTTSGFSPTTRYRDYAISRELIHWESQSRTNSSSPTGIRYQEHVQRGSSVHLFARLNATDRAFWYLGPATYVSHVGEMPMQVTWKLQAPLPGDLFAQFAAAVA
jgi:hypothetical protein